MGIMMKVFAFSCLLAVARAAPAADAEADPQYLAAGLPVAAPISPIAPIAYHAGPAPNCVTEDVILITQVCTPKAEEVCTTETMGTQEIEYEKVCQEIVDTLCDAAPVAVAGYHHVKREAEAEADAEADADPQYLAAPYAHQSGYAPVAPVAHAVAHSVTATVKHACREVTTEHCVDNPKIVEVPVEVEHCHTVTKVTCDDVENKLPKTTCEAVVTTETQHATVPVAAPVAYAGYHH